MADKRHVWMAKTLGKMNLICCQKCGFIRNDRNELRPCRGVVRVALRNEHHPKEVQDE